MPFEPEPIGPGGSGGGGGTAGGGGVTGAAEKAGDALANAIRNVKDRLGIKTGNPVTLGHLRGAPEQDMRTAGARTGYESSPGGAKPIGGQNRVPGANVAMRQSTKASGRNFGTGAAVGGTAAGLASGLARRGGQQGGGSKGAGASESGSPVHQPVSAPGTKHNFKAGVAQGGHSTTHPPTPETSHAHASRHTRPQHAVSKATGGTQHTHSSGSKAGAPAKKGSAKKGSAKKKTTKKKK